MTFLHGITTSNGRLCRWLLPYLVAVLFAGSFPCWATDPNTASSDAGSDPAIDAGDADPLADRLHRRISDTVVKTAASVDAFFYTDQTEVEENRTTFKVNLGVFAESGEGIDLESGTRLKLVMPGFQDRLHLVLSGNPDTYDEVLGESTDTLPEEDPTVDEGADGPSAALRFFVLDDLKRNLSFSAGVRIRDSQLVGFPEARYRRLFDLEDDDKVLRFEQRLIWYTDDGWRESTKVDLDVLLSEEFLLRTTLRGVWAEEDPGYAYNLNFRLFHRLWKRAALSYEWINAFDVCTVGQLDEVLLKANYRQSFWRPWLFFEIIPQVSFPETEDFDPIPGIRFRIEALFGHYIRPEGGDK